MVKIGSIHVNTVILFVKQKKVNSFSSQTETLGFIFVYMLYLRPLVFKETKSATMNIFRFFFIFFKIICKS